MNLSCEVRFGMDLSWGGGGVAWILVGEVEMWHGFELGGEVCYGFELVRWRCGMDLSWEVGVWYIFELVRWRWGCICVGEVDTWHGFELVRWGGGIEAWIKVE